MCESGLEFDACFHLEFSPSIVSFQSQPTGIEYQIGDKICRYTPDFMVVKSTGEVECIEIKLERVYSSQEFREDYEGKRAAYAALGYRLILVSEKQIRSGKLLSNLKILHRYANSSISVLHNLALQHIKQFKSLSIRELANKLGVLIGDCIATSVVTVIIVRQSSREGFPNS